MNKSVEPVYSVVQHRWRRLLVAAALVAIAGAVSFYSCGRFRSSGGPSAGPITGSTCATCPPSSLRPAPPCTRRAAPPMLAAPLARRLAAVPTPPLEPLLDMPHNGLSPAALATSERVITGLASAALTYDRLMSPSDSWAARLAAPGAADLMQYIVSCALDPCDHVAIPGDPALASRRAQLPDGFPGELGLCGARYRAVSGEAPWTDGPASDACVQRVSSCVLARVNPVEARVTISMRGAGMALRPKVPVETEFRENHGTPIQSFQACDRMCLWGDPLRRNCDWQPRFVGQCVHGQDGEAGRRVRLRLDGAAGRIRVCEGLYGCDDIDPTPGAGAATAPVISHGVRVTFPTAYGGQLLAQARGQTIEFACPANGPKVPDSDLRTGYYAVMVGSGDPASAAAVTGDVERVPAGPTAPPADPVHDRYPATEAQVFTYREGAFYGSLASDPGPAGLPGQLYACASSIWSRAAAVMEDRLCADPATDCFGSQTGACDGAPAAMCRPSEQPQGQDAYAACQAPIAPPLAFAQPYTVFLSYPCDLFASDAQCEALLEQKTRDGVAPRPDPGTRIRHAGGDDPAPR